MKKDEESEHLSDLSDTHVGTDVDAEELLDAGNDALDVESHVLEHFIRVNARLEGIGVFADVVATERTPQFSGEFVEDSDTAGRFGHNFCFGQNFLNSSFHNYIRLKIVMTS